MLVSLRSWVFLSLCLVVSARQIPQVDGVYGGVPSPTVADDVHADAAAQPKVSGTPVAGKMRFIENSGVCGALPLGEIALLDEQVLIFNYTETTPGVYQASGYADLTTTQSMW